MATLMNAIRRATTTSTLFTRFNSVVNHCHRHHPNNNRLATAAAACLSSSWLPLRRPLSSTTMYEENCTITAHGGSFTRCDEFPIRRGTCDQYMENPFQVSGPRGAYEVKKLEEGLFVRMEMPGIEKEDLKLRVEYGNVFVSGEGRRESEHEDSGRSYSANIELSSSSFEPRNITAKLKNGVLRMLIPLAKNFESASGSSEIKCS
ncbi:hypothetical protein RHMOL_Rhmol09G0046900 [Rhododendron molle]|uniref:Uncharacterized protein n=1 Tax=Rhododendron molle TaxID=49168 RepID=A0ACC0MAE2_RHOML|nr:hypothetical protein RHMOL_Rhmol09G0046900 [Rhododendron molle]